MQPADETARELAGIPAVEVVTAEVAVGGAVLQEVVGDHEEAVGHRDGRAFLPAPAGDPVGLGPEVARGVAGRPGRLPEGRPDGWGDGTPACTQYSVETGV